MAQMGGSSEQRNSSCSKAGSYERASDFWGGLVAGTLDAVDGVVAFGTQGLNPIQVLQYIASGALGQSAFHGGLGTAALGAALHFSIAWVAAAVFVLATRRLEILKTHAVPAGLLYGVAVYFFMN
jgi:hypothetical protein